MTYAANPFWSRVMSRPVEAPPEADPEPQLPPSAHGRDHFGEHTPDISELRQSGQYAEPVVTPAPLRTHDGRTTDGEPSNARSHPSPWRAFDFGNTFDE